MTNAIMEYEANGEIVELSKDDVKAYLVNGYANSVTDQEVQMFMALCKYQGLNPWLREAYLIKYSEKNPAQIVVGKEAYMKRATSQPDFERFEAGVIVQRGDEVLELEGAFHLPKDALVGGWAKVYKKGIDQPTVSRVSIKEYSKGQSTWTTMPSTMIRKVAIVQAMREAYPIELGGMYTAEEAQNVTYEEAPAEEAEAPKKHLGRTAKKQVLPGKEEEENDQIIEIGEEGVTVEDLANEEELEGLYNAFSIIGIDNKTASSLIEERYGKSSSKELTSEEVSDLISFATEESMKKVEGVEE